MRVIRLDLNWLEACVALDGEALGGFWSERQWERELMDSRRMCFGLLEDHRLLAMACGWLVVDELHITVIATDPRRRREGLGFTLLRELLQRARQLGAAHATLEVAADNHPAIALYARCGFQTAGSRAKYYRDGRDALIQWLRLSDSR